VFCNVSFTKRAKTLGALAGVSGIWFDDVDFDEEEVNDISGKTR
jgi:hypothetical protein